MTLGSLGKAQLEAAAVRSQPATNGVITPPVGAQKELPAFGPARKDWPRPGEAGQQRMAQAFAQVVAVLMRDPGYKNLRVTDLEWLVLPPIMAGQFRLAHGATQPHSGETHQGGVLVPVAAALWARVSPAVDKSLTESLDKPVRLSPGAWTSGDILWLMAVAGDRRATPAFLKQLHANDFQGRRVKMRLRTPEGKLVVSDLSQTASAA